MHRVLLIEDDEDQQALLAQYIKNLGYDLNIAGTASEGLDLVESWDPHILLLDLYLPDKTGLEVLKLLKESGQKYVDIPVLLMSAENSEEITVVGLSSGAADFLVKPIRMAELMAKIQNNLELYYYKQELKNLNTKLEREKRLLTKYFSQDLVDKILTEEVSPELGGSNLTASILFLDIRNSTSIAENLDPGDFASFISLLFSDVMDLIFSNNGSVNKLLGDGILATFGCPVATDDDVYNCVKCALSVREYLNTFNSVRPEYLTSPIAVGMGISTGKVFAGNIGSMRRMEYTVMGDPVNVAARLQGLTKKLECDILCDEKTFMSLEDMARAEKVENVVIRGKDGVSSLYKLENLVAEPADT